MNKTNISWCDMTWNPFVGCMNNCAYCYARQLHRKRHQAVLNGKKLPVQYNMPFNHMQFFPERLEEPLKRKKPTTIFLGSMGDIGFLVDPRQVQAILDVIKQCPQHTFMVLTKAPEDISDTFPHLSHIPNLWMGVTVTNQVDANTLIPQLLKWDVAHRFISIEPMLGPVDLTDCVTHYHGGDEHHWSPLNCDVDPEDDGEWHGNTLDLVILGGMTGPGAFSIKKEWVRKVRDDCHMHQVPFHFKQWGDNPDGGCFCHVHGTNARMTQPHGGCVLDGRTFRWYPGKDGE